MILIWLSEKYKKIKKFLKKLRIPLQNKSYTNQIILKKIFVGKLDPPFEIFIFQYDIWNPWLKNPLSKMSHAVQIIFEFWPVFRTTIPPRKATVGICVFLVFKKKHQILNSLRICARGVFNVYTIQKKSWIFKCLFKISYLWFSIFWFTLETTRSFDSICNIHSLFSSSKYHVQFCLKFFMTTQLNLIGTIVI